MRSTMTTVLTLALVSGHTTATSASQPWRRAVPALGGAAKIATSCGQRQAKRGRESCHGDNDATGVSWLHLLTSTTATTFSHRARALRPASHRPRPRPADPARGGLGPDPRLSARPQLRGAPRVRPQPGEHTSGEAAQRAGEEARAREPEPSPSASESARATRDGSRAAMVACGMQRSHAEPKANKQAPRGGRGCACLHSSALAHTACHCTQTLTHCLAAHTCNRHPCTHARIHAPAFMPPCLPVCLHACRSLPQPDLPAH